MTIPPVKWVFETFTENIARIADPCSFDATWEKKKRWLYLRAALSSTEWLSGSGGDGETP